MSEQARAAAEKIGAIAPLDTSEAARQFLNNEQYDNDKFALNLDKTESIIDAAITATAALRAENERLRARLRNSTMPLPNAQDLIDAQAERLLLARLAKCQEEPQFYNPLEAAAAITLRDRVLAEAGARTATSAHGQ
jgi:hypothetical protein